MKVKKRKIGSKMKSWRDFLPDDWWKFCNGIIEDPRPYPFGVTPAYSNMADGMITIRVNHPFMLGLDEEGKANLVKHEYGHLKWIPGSAKRNIAILDSMRSVFQSLRVRYIIAEFLANGVIDRYLSRQDPSYAKLMEKTCQYLVDRLGSATDNLEGAVYLSSIPLDESYAYASQKVSLSVKGLADEFRQIMGSIDSIETKAHHMAKRIAEELHKLKEQAPKLPSDSKGQPVEGETAVEDETESESENGPEPLGGFGEESSEESGSDKEDSKENNEESGDPKEGEQSKQEPDKGKGGESTDEVKDGSEPGKSDESPDMTGRSDSESELGDDKTARTDESEIGQESQQQSQQQTGSMGRTESEQKVDKTAVNDEGSDVHGSSDEEGEGSEDQVGEIDPSFEKEVEDRLSNILNNLKPSDSWGTGRCGISEHMDYEELLERVKDVEVETKEPEDDDEESELIDEIDELRKTLNRQDEFGISNSVVEELAKLYKNRKVVSLGTVEQLARRLKVDIEVLKAVALLHALRKLEGGELFGEVLGGVGPIPFDSKTLEEPSELDDVYISDLPITERTDWTDLPSVVRRVNVSRPAHFLTFIDVSTSMKGYDSDVHVSKLTNAKITTMGILKAVKDAGGSVEMFVFHGATESIGYFDAKDERRSEMFKSLAITIANLDAGGMDTRFDIVMSKIIEVSPTLKPNPDHPKIEVIMITDGESHAGYLTRVKEVSHVHTVFIEPTQMNRPSPIKPVKSTRRRRYTPPPRGRVELQRISKETGGQFFEVTNIDQVPRLLKETTKVLSQEALAGIEVET